MNKIKILGQVFTRTAQIETMLQLRQNNGRCLEPSCGNGAFINRINDCVGIEIDKDVCPPNCLNMDFFDYPIDEKFDTIIGNPPYVKGKLILPETRSKLNSSIIPIKNNLYLHFIEKCFYHLTDNGEIVFISPKDFLCSATGAEKLNKLLIQHGTITHFYDLSGKMLFDGVNLETCCIWRYQKGNFERSTITNNGVKQLIHNDGKIYMTNNVYTVPFSDLFYIKVGAVQGQGNKFIGGDREFIFSKTRVTGQTRMMNYQPKEWVRALPSQEDREKERIYVNCKTTCMKPFFTHKCKDWDGSVFAIFPKQDSMNIDMAVEMLNNVDWADLGFLWNGKLSFTHRSLTKCLLPPSFLSLQKSRKARKKISKQNLPPAQTQGKVPTPDRMVTQMHDWIQTYDPITLHKSYWDNSCGDGSRFPSDIYDRYFNEYLLNKEKYKKELNITNEDEAHRYIVENCIFCSEIDQKDVDQCIDTLLNKRKRYKGKIKVNCVCCDSLLDNPFPGRLFNYIVGNPPYLGFQRRGVITEEYKQKLQKNFQCFDRLGDIYHLFIELAVDRLAEGGTICYVTQDTLTKRGAADKVRALLSNKGSIVNHKQEWFDPRTDKANVLVRMFIFRADKSQSETLFVANPILNKLSRNKRKLGDITSMTIGAVTGADSCFTVTAQQIQNLKLEEHACKRLIKGKHSRTYRLIDNNLLDEYLIVANNIDETEIPNVVSYLNQHKETLKNRHVYRNRSVKRLCDITQISWKKEKGLIVSASFTDTCRDFSWCVATNSIGIGSAISVNNLPPIWLSILNSNVAAYYFKMICTERVKKRWHRTVKDLQSFPIPNADCFDLVAPQLDKLVNVMLENPTDKETFEEINRIIYQLYNMSAKDIEIIEKELSGMNMTSSLFV